jgi:putative DNA primase/helicase
MTPSEINALLATWHPTDLGNADRFALRNEERVRYWAERRKWLVWDWTRWRLDESDAVMQLAGSTARAILNEASTIDEKRARDAMIGWARTSESAPRLRAMVELARSNSNLIVRSHELDADPFLLNCQNGTLDLRTGQLRPHTRGDHLTKLAPVRYDPDAACPTWLAFLDRIFAGDQGLVDFMQSALGYSLSGLTEEQAIFILYGGGANGKSTLLETIRAILGDYATNADARTFLTRHGDGPRNDLARLDGARFVSAAETGEGHRLDEVLVKQATGGEPITARYLYGEHFEYVPQFKLFLATNHRPEIRNGDYGIWRRVRLVPFNVTIPPSEQDRRLRDKLSAELPGILAWAVRGFQRQQAHGLGWPTAVREATATYQLDMDPLRDFIEDCCDLDQSAWTRTSDIWETYIAWAGRNEQSAIGRQAFFGRLRDRGCTPKPGTGGVRGWQGILLREDQAARPSGLVRSRLLYAA